MGTRTRQARGPQETPHCGADRSRRWRWRRTRSEPTRSAEVSPTARPHMWLRQLQACRGLARIGAPASVLEGTQVGLRS